MIPHAIIEFWLHMTSLLKCLSFRGSSCNIILRPIFLWVLVTHSWLLILRSVLQCSDILHRGLSIKDFLMLHCFVWLRGQHFFQASLHFGLHLFPISIAPRHPSGPLFLSRLAFIMAISSSWLTSVLVWWSSILGHNPVWSSSQL